MADGEPALIQPESGYVLGVSAYFHDSAACLLKDGRIIAAAQEERFSRKKHDDAFPVQAATFCLTQAGIRARDLDLLAYYEKPFLTFERLLRTWASTAPRGLRGFLRAAPAWFGTKLWLPRVLRQELGYHGPLVFTEHHEAHAASAFWPSPFEEAAVLTCDAVGEWASGCFGRASRSEGLELLAEHRFPHSLGMLYSAFTAYLGFRVNNGEYKVMGLAPYGAPAFEQTILDELIDLKDDGSFRLNMRYFSFLEGTQMVNSAFEKLLGGPTRVPESPLEQRHMDLARSVQAVAEEVLLRQVRHVHEETGLKHLCLAGGVALNCVANGRILREGPFEEIWVQPAANDAGGALGAALTASARVLGVSPEYAGPGSDSMSGALLGPDYSARAMAAAALRRGYRVEPLPDDKLLDEVAGLLANGIVVGWFQGRMEYGPRALGARSILADPRQPEMQRTLNRAIKFRETFRPFAPIILEDRAPEFFDLSVPSPYMLLVAPIASEQRLDLPDNLPPGLERLRVPRSRIPAVTHVDDSARIQTVRRGSGRLSGLLEAWESLTECPVLVNTSFNVRGEPIVCSPDDAIRCFEATDMGALVLGDLILRKAAVGAQQMEAAQ